MIFQESLVIDRDFLSKTKVQKISSNFVHFLK